MIRNPEQRDEELVTLRPKYFQDFIGQDGLCDNLKIFIQAAKNRGEPLDHILLHGPPGLGKTTLAQVIAHEMGVNIKITSGPVIAKAGELAALLTNLQPHDILFIDEIHRLNVAVEEILYSAMEDFKLDIMIGEGPAARSIRIDLPPFTLIGATTRSGLLTQPLRERFGIPLRLQYYELKDLCHIIQRASTLLNCIIDTDGADEVGRRSRGTPRIAGRLLRRCRDFASVHNSEGITLSIAKLALDQLEVDHFGLDFMDQKYLKMIAEFYNGGPVGLDTISAALSEQRDTIEDVIEPYLIQNGFIQRTARGRVLTDLAYQHMGLPKKDGATIKTLFE